MVTLCIKDLLHPAMIKLFTLTTLLLTLVVFAQQPHEENNDKATTNEQQQNSTEQNANTDSFEVFVPSESISGDQSVDLPTDI